MKKKFCMGLQKDQEAVYLSLRDMMSSEEEDYDDEDVLINDRLDQLQAIDSDQDLVDLLTGMCNFLNSIFAFQLILSNSLPFFR